MKRTIAKLLAIVMLISMTLLPMCALAMPDYSMDGTCAGSGCHAEGEYGDPAPAPAPAETVAEEEVPAGMTAEEVLAEIEAIEAQIAALLEQLAELKAAVAAL